MVILMKPLLKAGIWLILFVFICLLPTQARAEERKDEWKKSGYDFSGMKKVFVKIEFSDDVHADDLKRYILIDKVKANFSQNLNFAKARLSFLSQEELVGKLSNTSGEDIAALETSDPVRYQKMLQDGVDFYCQAILQVRYRAYQDTVEHIPDRIETYQTTKEVRFNKVVTATNGSQVTVDEWINVPVTESRIIPAHDEVTAHTDIELTLLDTKTRQPIWKIVDSRDALDKDKDGMVDRILKRVAERFVAVKES